MLLLWLGLLGLWRRGQLRLWGLKHIVVQVGGDARSVERGLAKAKRGQLKVFALKLAQGCYLSDKSVCASACVRECVRVHRT